MQNAGQYPWHGSLKDIDEANLNSNIPTQLSPCISHLRQPAMQKHRGLSLLG